MLASMQSRNPYQVVKLTGEVWKYLAGTWDLALQIKPLDMCDDSGKVFARGTSPERPVATVRVMTDASFAPGGDISRSGIVIAVNGCITHWASNKQSLAAMSSCEAELNATLTGIKLEIGIRAIVEYLSGLRNICMQLRGDNYATLYSITNESASWRNRHYAIRASGTRDLNKQETLEVKHGQGSALVSDALTKVLERVKIQGTRRRFQLL
jgi:hypothetical protein